MNTSIDIKNKESSLVELMGRILKEPLSPLEKTLETLKKNTSEIEIRISELNETFGASVYDAEQKSKKNFNKIQDAEGNLKSYIFNKTEEETHKIVAVLDKNANLYADFLRSVAGVLSEEIANQKTELNQSFEVACREVDLKFESLHGMMKTALNGIDLNRRLIERNFLDLDTKLGEICNQILIEQKGEFTEVKALLSKNLSTLEVTSKSIDEGQNRLIASVRQQNSALAAEIGSNKTKLNYLMSIVSSVFILMLIRFGFDIWGH